MTVILPITNEVDIIDTRDLLDYIAELDPTRDADELYTLSDIIAEVRDNSNESPEDGVSLVHNSYLTNYARELAEEIGAVPPKLEWPLYCIDWEYAARELKVYYSYLNFDGVRYWYR